MLLGLCSDLLMEGKSLIIEAHELRILFVLQILGSTQPLLCQNCVDVCFCFILFTQLLLVKWGCLILSSIHLSPALWNFSSVKSCLLRSFSPWSANLLKKILVPLRTNACITETPIGNNADTIYFVFLRRYDFWHHLKPQKFHDPNTPSQKLHITFNLFASMCNQFLHG